jgi:hypothetical protein
MHHTDTAEDIVPDSCSIGIVILSNWWDILAKGPTHGLREPMERLLVGALSSRQEFGILDTFHDLMKNMGQVIPIILSGLMGV